MDKARGIDVSHHQGFVNWQEVAKEGIKFAFIRSSAVGTQTGRHFVDRRFEQNWENAQKAGLLITAYHFYVPQQNCTDQIDFFIATVGNRTRNFPLILDFEHTGGLSPDQISACIEQAVQAIEAETQQKPIIYTRRNWWHRSVPVDPKWNNFNLWVANYENPNGPLKPDHWNTWHFWQWSDKGTVRGISTPVDLNWFNGNDADLLNFAF